MVEAAEVTCTVFPEVVGAVCRTGTVEADTGMEGTVEVHVEGVTGTVVP